MKGAEKPIVNTASISELLSPMKSYHWTNDASKGAILIVTKHMALDRGEANMPA